MINKQFVFSQSPLEFNSLEFKSLKFSNSYLYYHQNLEVFQSISGDKEIVLLGFIINPENFKKSNQEIIDDLVKLENKENLFHELESLSGRFIILYKNLNEQIMFHDMFGQRQINYTFLQNQLYCSSSVKLLSQTIRKEVDFIPNHEELLSDKGFQLYDHWFLGDLTWDKNIKKLLPNHYIDLNKNEIKRIPFSPIESLSKNEVIDYIHTIIKGNYNAISLRYDHIFQALTSGYDSRTLLSFSQEHWDKIQFYTFYRGDTNSGRDSKIAKKLSKTFDFNHISISKLEKNFEFEKIYKEQFIIPRTSPKFYNILYFKNLNLNNCINITGDGVQMVRNLRSPNQLDSATKLFDSLKYSYHRYHIENFTNWLESAKQVSVENEVLISDLFTQEIAQGQLTARWSHEFDLSDCEEFNPFNHKKMIYLILKNIPNDQRIAPNYNFQKEIINSSVKELASVPFNPPTWKDRVKMLIGRK